MKPALIIPILAMFSLTACDKNPAHEPFVPPAQITPSPTLPAPSSPVLPPGHPAIKAGDSPMAESPDVEPTEQATVVSKIDIEGFSYLEVKQHNATRWLAAKSTQANRGAVIEFDSGSTMTNFESKVLDRTFPSMTFVNSITVVKGK